jgi:hypothetical protein
MGKIVQKVIKYAKSPEGQKVIRAGGKFLKQSGLAQKVVDKINSKISKKTKKNPTLDQARENIYNAVSIHTKPNNKKNYLDAGIDFFEESGLFNKAFPVNKQISGKSSKNPLPSIMHRLANSELPTSKPFSKSGVDQLAPRRSTNIFEPHNNLVFRGEKMGFQ